MCEVVGDHSINNVDLEYPFDIFLSTEGSRLDVPGIASTATFKHCTSDELAGAAVALAAEWRILAMSYNLLSATGMRVTSADPGLSDSVPTQAARDAAHLRRDLQAAADLNSLDPLSDDPRRRRAAKRPRTGTPTGNAKAKPQPRRSPEVEDDNMALVGQASDVESSGEGEGVVPVPGSMAHVDDGLVSLSDGVLMDASVVENLLGDTDLADDGEPPVDGLFETPVEPKADASSPSALGALAAVAGDGAVAAPSASAQAAALVAMDSVLADLSSVTGVGAEEPAPLASSSSSVPVADPPLEPDGQVVAPPSSSALRADRPAISILPVGEAVPGGPAGWTKSGAGYIYDAERRSKGRITGWGPKVAVRSTSGKSHAFNRERATDGQLMVWLQSGFAPHLRPDQDAGSRAEQGPAQPTQP